VVKDIFVGAVSSSPNNLNAYNGLVYFMADSSNSDDLWVSDGTESGTVVLKDFMPGDDDTYSENPMGADGKLFFFAETPEYGYELWVTDGIPETTQRLSDFDFDFKHTTDEDFFFALNNKIFFFADNGKLLKVTLFQYTQTLDFPVIDNKTYGDVDFNLVASATSGGKVTFASSDTTVLKIIGSTAQIIKPGDVTITAVQEGNSDTVRGRGLTDDYHR